MKKRLAIEGGGLVALLALAVVLIFAAGPWLGGTQPAEAEVHDTLASIHGVKWEDTNGDAVRDPDEPGLPGVTIYFDLNSNGVLDAGEPRVVTMEDDLGTTTIDESGVYWLTDVESGVYLVREVVPDGFEQTFPSPIFDGAHEVTLEPGDVVEGIDFGNQPILPAAPHIFIGTASVNGLPVVAGTLVVGIIAGVEKGSTTVTDSSGSYTLLVDEGEGAVVRFDIGSLAAQQTALWVEGAADVLDLTASSIGLGSPCSLVLATHYADGLMTVDVTFEKGQSGVLNIWAIKSDEVIPIVEQFEWLSISPPETKTATKEATSQGIIDILATLISGKEVCSALHSVDTG